MGREFSMHADYRITELVGKPEEKKSLGRPGLRFEDNIKMNLGEVVQLLLSQERLRAIDLVNLFVFLLSVSPKRCCTLETTQLLSMSRSSTPNCIKGI
jgi:hypothetical protein